MKEKLQKLGPFGAVITAAACPVCFPKLALVGAFLGMGGLAKYEAVFFIATQLFVLAMLVGYVVHFRRYGNPWLLALVVVSTLVFFVSLYVFVSEYMSYAALAGLIAAAIWLVLENRSRGARACAENGKESEL